MELLEKIKKYYWACGECNQKAGGVWPEGHCATVTQGQCQVCKTKHVTLVPWVDYNWPENKDDKFAKVLRD